jgi:hypothetical protein
MRGTFQRCSAAAALLALLLFAGCSQSSSSSGDSSAAAAPAAPAQLITAQTAFGTIYKSALAWSPDVQLLSLKPKDVPGFTNAAGKAAMWEAQLASASKHQYRVYSYAIAAAPPSIHKGVQASLPMLWAGPTRDVMPIDLSVFTVDSDTAYQAAAQQAGDWLKKNSDKPLTALEIENTYQFHAPVWYVAWGDKKSGGYIALVDAASGKAYKSK